MTEYSNNHSGKALRVHPVIDTAFPDYTAAEGNSFPQQGFNITNSRSQHTSHLSTKT